MNTMNMQYNIPTEQGSHRDIGIQQSSQESVQPVDAIQKAHYSPRLLQTIQPASAHNSLS